MDFEIATSELLYNNMTDRGFSLWMKIKEKIPPIWNKPSSSTGKYHLDDNGKVHSVIEHTYEMLFVCTKIMKLLKVDPKTKNCDILLLSILFHDAFKYGLNNPLTRYYTVKNHDKISGDCISSQKNLFRQYYDDKEIEVLEECVRYHSGQWSTDIDDKNKFTFSKLNPETMFIHMLDMLSTNNCLKNS